MRRFDLTKVSLIVSLACIVLFGGYVVGAKSPQASSHSPEAESSRVLEGSLVTFQYVATVPDSPGIDYGMLASLFRVGGDRPALEQEIVG